MNYWLIKSEPSVYSLENLKTEKQAIWDGVRNYQARNYLRQMQIDDFAFFYHSNTKVPGIVGLAQVKEAAIADPTQFDPDSPYYDSKSTKDSPRWQTVIVEFVENFPHLISLTTLKQDFTAEELILVKKGNRLSVMPISSEVAQRILKLAKP